MYFVVVSKAVHFFNLLNDVDNALYCGSFVEIILVIQGLRENCGKNGLCILCSLCKCVLKGP